MINEKKNMFIENKKIQIYNNLLIDDKKRKDAIIQQVKNIFKSKEIIPKSDKELLKHLFKIVEFHIKYFEEDDLLLLDRQSNMVNFSKLILALRFKENLTINNKIKMVKELFSKYDLIEFIIIEKILLNEEDSFIFDFQEIEDEGTKKEYKIKIQYINVIRILIKIIRCILYNHHKKDIIYFENGVPKYKLTNIKNIIWTQSDVYLYNHISASVLESTSLRIINDLNIERDLSHSHFDIIVDDILNIRTSIEYNKYLLDKKYLTTLTNEETNSKDMTVFTINPVDFTKRRVLTPKNGVILLIENDEIIESIFLFEKIVLEYNNICFITRYKDGREIMNSIILNDETKICATIHSLVNDINKYSYENVIQREITDYIYDFYEVKKNEDLKYSVIAPGYWKYRKNNYMSENDKVNNRGVIVRKEFEVEVAPFIRKINGQPSQEALKLARQLGVDLEDKYTIVKPHTRIYNKVKSIVK